MRQLPNDIILKFKKFSLLFVMIHKNSSFGKLSWKVRYSWFFRINNKWQQSLREVTDVPGLNQWLVQLAIACVDFSWTHFHDSSGELLRHHNARKPGGFLVRMRGKSDEFALHCYVPQVAPECVDAAASPAERSSSSTDATDTKKKLNIDEMKAALLARIESWKGNWQRQIGEDFGEGDLRDDNHLKARNVLLHPQLYSGNLSNVKHIDIEQVLAQVARVNRLPHCNSLQANRIMHAPGLGHGGSLHAQGAPCEVYRQALVPCPAAHRRRRNDMHGGLDQSVGHHLC